MKVQLDEADRILIATAEKAMKLGVGRTFRTKGGVEVRVEAIDEKWIHLAHGPGYRTELRLPRRIREIAQKTALLQGRIR